MDRRSTTCSMKLQRQKDSDASNQNKGACPLSYTELSNSTELSNASSTELSTASAELSNASGTELSTASSTELSNASSDVWHEAARGL